MLFAIRLASIDDVGAMHRLRNSVLENRLSDPHRVLEADYHPYVAACSIWVAVSGKDIVGFGAIDAPAATLWALFVDPVAEGRGVGRALLRHMDDWARGQGIRRLSLTTGKGTRAQKFYEQAGYRSGVSNDGEVLMEKALQL